MHSSNGLLNGALLTCHHHAFLISQPRSGLVFDVYLRSHVVVLLRVLGEPHSRWIILYYFIYTQILFPLKDGGS